MDIILTLEEMWPDAHFRISDNDYDSLVWLSPPPEEGMPATPTEVGKPSYKELEAAYPEAVEKRAMRELREQRDALLASSDWTQTLDVPVDQAAWAAYRQELRDLPENTIDPENPIWPAHPE